MSALFNVLADCWREGHKVALNIFRFLIPILIAVKLLEESGLIPYLAMPMRPMMRATTASTVSGVTTPRSRTR